MSRVGDGIDGLRHGQHERTARRAGDPRRWSVQCHTSLIRAGSEGFRRVQASDGVGGEEGGVRVESDQSGALCRLVDGSRGNMLVEAEELDGFFVSPGDDSSEVAFLRALLGDEHPRQVEDAVLEVVDAQGERIGEYLVGRVIFGDSGTEAAEREVRRVSFRFFGDRCEYPEAAGIWQRWASGPSLQAGEWLHRPAGHHRACCMLCGTRGSPPVTVLPATETRR
jgi:hypothetical protein